MVILYSLDIYINLSYLSYVNCTIIKLLLYLNDNGRWIAITQGLIGPITIKTSLRAKLQLVFNASLFFNWVEYRIWYQLMELFVEPKCTYLSVRCCYNARRRAIHATGPQGGWLWRTWTPGGITHPVTDVGRLPDYATFVRKIWPMTKVYG